MLRTSAVPAVKSRYRRHPVASILLGCLFLLLSLSTVYSRASAENSTIHATLCDSTSQPVLTITDPISLSVVTNMPSIAVSGTAMQTSQIDVSINGAYSGSLAIGVAEAFTTTLGLQKGDNTIVFHAYFSCNNTSADTTIIVTYNPAVVPPIDNNPGTTTNQTPSGEGTVSSGATNRDGQGGVWSTGGESSTPSDEQKGIVDRIRDNLGIGEQGSGYRTDLAGSQVVGLLVISWLALVMMIVGILIMSIPGACLRILSRLQRGVAGVKKAKRWIRLAGAGCMVVGFIILQM